MVEQLICNQQVAGSSPITSSKRTYSEYVLLNGRVPEWPKGTDCKSAAFSFGGSNPPSSTTSEQALYRLLRFFMQKIRVRSFRCSSSFAKSHARLAYSFVNALIYGSLSLPTFFDSAFGTLFHIFFAKSLSTPIPHHSNLYIACSDFLCKKSEFAHATTPPLSQKVTFTSATHLQAHS